MKKIEVNVYNKKTGELSFEREKNSYIFNYTDDISQISLIMPYRTSSYIRKYKLHPIFDMNMPEGYLFEILKKYISKEHGYIDDFLTFSYLCSNIQSRLTYNSWCNKNEFLSFNMDEILNNDSPNTFNKLVNAFISKNAISGVQPKSLAILEDKESLTTKEYIIKTWGDEYEHLSLNEYFCLNAVKKTGVEIPNIRLSKNNKFLVVERFNYDNDAKSFLGFEEVLTLLGKNKDEKYSGSYEVVAKLVYSVSTDKLKCIKNLYKVIVMNYLLKNGDAHLKNFGILYDKDFKNIWFAPAYDIVNTTAYFFKDRPALTMFGKKMWFGKKELLKFGHIHCYISKKECEEIYSKCIVALQKSITELEKHIKTDKDFIDIAQRMLASWKLSLDEKTYKELPDAVTRDWK